MSDGTTHRDIDISNERVGRDSTFPTDPEMGDLFILTTRIDGPPVQEPGIYYRNATTWILAAQIDTTNTIDSALSSTSTNPLENRVINTQVTELRQAIANGSGSTLPFGVNVAGSSVRDTDYTLRDDNDYDTLISINSGILTFNINEDSPSISNGQR